MGLDIQDIGDRYSISAPLGRGGMAQVFLVRHQKLGSLHALKVLEVTDPASRERFMQEGRIQSALRHPNIVPVTDLIEVSGYPALIMDYIDGPSLGELLEQQSLSLEQVDHLVRGIVAGVAEAHRHGLIHRDLKPSNILLDVHCGNIVPRVVDFGIAKMLGGDQPGGSARTRTGAALGTPAYMAPEQVRDTKSVTTQADIFALGAILYELVTGRRAFERADVFETLKAVTSGEYCPVRALVPDIPERMERAIQGALQVEKGRRITDCETLLRVWRGEDGETSATTPATPWSLEQLEGLRSGRPGTGEVPATLETPVALNTSDYLSIAPEVPVTGSETVADERGIVETRQTTAQEPPAPQPAPAAVVERWPAWWVFPAGTLTGLPVLAGILVLYGDFIGVLVRGGPFMGLVLLLAAIGVGTASWLAVAEARGRAYTGGWLVFPALTVFAGTLGTYAGIFNLDLAADGVDLAVKAKLLNMGLSISLVTEFSGMALGAELLLVAAVLQLWTQRRHLALRQPGTPALVAVGLAVTGGLALWILQAVAFWKAGHGDAPAHFLVFLSLVSTSVCLAAFGLGGQAVSARARVVAGLASVLAVAAASRAGEVQKQLNLLDELALQEPADLLQAAERFVGYLDTVSMAFPVAWTVLAAVVVSIVVWDLRGQVVLVRLRHVVLPLLLVALVACMQVVVQNSKQGVIDRVLPAYLGTVSGWYFGFALEDYRADSAAPWARDGLRAPQPPEGGEIGPDDVIIAVNDLPLDSVADLLQRLRDCDCAEQGGACTLAATCLDEGTELELTLLRAPGDSTSDARLERIQVPLVVREPSAEER